jgi:hypothetical protein
MCNFYDIINVNTIEDSQNITQVNNIRPTYASSVLGSHTGCYEQLSSGI